MTEQEATGVAEKGAAGTPPPDSNPQSQPEDGRIVFETKDEYEKAINAGRSDLGRVNADLKAQLDAKTTEIDGLRTAQQGIITTQRQSILDGVKDDADATARLKVQFATEDKETAANRRSNDLDARERQIAASATANSAITAEAEARKLETTTGVPAQRLLNSPLVKDTAENGTVTYDLSKMAQLADDLKGTGETKGVEAVGARTPAALAAAADDTTFMRAWGRGELPPTKENKERAKRIHQSLPTTV